jgi:hypothetical protein
MAFGVLFLASINAQTADFKPNKTKLGASV